MSQTCLPGGTWGRVGYPSPGSQWCPARGGVQSESGGWSNSTPHPGTPLPVTGSATGVSGKRPGKSCPPRGGWGGVESPPGPPAPRRDGSGGASSATLMRPQLCTPGTSPSSAVAPKIFSLSPSSISRRPLLTSCLMHGMACIPC